MQDARPCDACSIMQCEMAISDGSAIWRSGTDVRHETHKWGCSRVNLRLACPYFWSQRSKAAADAASRRLRSMRNCSASSSGESRSRIRSPRRTVSCAGRPASRSGAQPHPWPRLSRALGRGLQPPDTCTAPHRMSPPESAREIRFARKQE